MKTEIPPNSIKKPNYVLDFNDEFVRPTLDTTKWIPHHLPQWASRHQARANFQFEASHLQLTIDAGQEPWCPELDPGVRVSSLQTGLFAGPVGSPQGQHRFNPKCVVREAQENRATYTPMYGYFEMRACGIKDPENHVALWMIGYEDAPERSAEICICEIFGKNAGTRLSKIGMGVHPFGDPSIRDDFREVELPIDVSEFHIYAAEWTPTHIDYYIDNQRVGTVEQSPRYPMQFMLGIYERPIAMPSTQPSAYPKKFVVDYFRAYQPIGGYR